MDRFIDVSLAAMNLFRNNLKSNMDRFIAVVEPAISIPIEI